MNKKSIRMILGVSLNVIVIAVGVFIIFTAGSKAYTFGHNIFDEEAVSSEAQARETQVTISDGITSKQLAKLLYDKRTCKKIRPVFDYQIILSDYKDKFVEVHALHKYGDDTDGNDESAVVCRYRRG